MMTAGTATTPPRTLLLNFRVTEDEKRALRQWAGTVPLGEAIRTLLWRAMGTKDGT